MLALRHALLLLLSVGCCVSSLLAQPGQPPQQLVYLIGNTSGQSSSESERLKLLHEHLSQQSGPTALVHLGDFVHNRGLPSADDSTTNIDARLGLLLGLGGKSVEHYFIPGDKDWANSGPEGLNTVLLLEKKLEKLGNSKNLVLPAHGCPGPEVIELGDNLVMIAFSTQWWLHQHLKPEAPATDCPTLTPDEVMEELESAIESAEGKNILLVGHHPLFSNGVYGGHTTLRKHLFPLSDLNPANRIPLPVLGSLYTYYRQNVGTVRDMAHPGYQNLIHEFEKVTELHSGLVFAGAHDYNLQQNYVNGNYHLVSGSLINRESCGKSRETNFRSGKFGFSRLEYYADGTVLSRFYTIANGAVTEAWADTLFQSECGSHSNNIPVNEHFVPCLAQAPLDEAQPLPYPDSTVVIAGDYGGGYLKRMFFGTLYRSTWATPVQMPYLNLDTVKGGLRAVSRGGGRQTNSLKLLGNDGREYVFRSVDKDPVKALSPELRNTFVTTVVRDMTATQHPYGAIPVSRMLDATSILHARPTLYVLPDHPALGAFRQEYAGLFGMLEERPYDPKPGIGAFYGADDVTRSVRLFRKLYRDNEVQVDAEAFARARVFDLLIGDWGRHEDNWKWLGYKTDTSWLYRPIPRDRDHAFSQWDGVLPWLADRRWARPNTENFGMLFRDLRSLTWQNRHYDRFLLNGLSRNQWQEAAEYILSTVTDSVVRASMKSLPPEVMRKSGAEIGRKLIRRRIELKEAADVYYLLLAKEVEVVGSNKAEYFEVTRKANGWVTVRVFDLDKKTLGPKGSAFYARTFDPKVTREIRLFGLDGNDRFVLTGAAKSSIRVRVIGGFGDDVVQDESTVNGWRKHTIVYDEPAGATVAENGETRTKLRNDPMRNHYNRTAFHYNTYRPMPVFVSNVDDGYGGGLSWEWTRQKWGKPDFASKFKMSALATSNEAAYGEAQGRWHHVLAKWDLVSSVGGGNWFPYYRFYGVGNNTTIDEQRQDADGYRARYRGFNASALLDHKLLRNGKIYVGPTYERYEVDRLWNAYSVDEISALSQFRNMAFTGIKAGIDINLLDNTALPFRGVRIQASHHEHQVSQASGRYTLTPDARFRAPTNFGLSSASVAWYGTARLGLPITVGLHAGGEKATGNDVPFYKLPTLGQTNHLRGYVRNRFSGDEAVYLNTELRIHLGTVKSRVLPFEVGVSGFYDRGKVRWQNETNAQWHAGYGAGFYLAPISHDYFVLTAAVEASQENAYLVRVGLGMPFGR